MTDTDLYEELIEALVNALNHYVLYSSTHPQVKQSCLEVVGHIGKLFEDCPEGAFYVQVIEGRIIHEGHLLVARMELGRFGEMEQPFDALVGSLSFRSG